MNLPNSFWPPKPSVLPQIKPLRHVYCLPGLYLLHQTWFRRFGESKSVAYRFIGSWGIWTRVWHDRDVVLGIRKPSKEWPLMHLSCTVQIGATPCPVLFQSRFKDKMKYNTHTQLSACTHEQHSVSDNSSLPLMHRSKLGILRLLKWSTLDYSWLSASEERYFSPASHSWTNVLWTSTLLAMVRGMDDHC